MVRQNSIALSARIMLIEKVNKLVIHLNFNVPVKMVIQILTSFKYVPLVIHHAYNVEQIQDYAILILQRRISRLIEVVNLIQI